MDTRTAAAIASELADNRLLDRAVDVAASDPIGFKDFLLESVYDEDLNDAVYDSTDEDLEAVGAAVENIAVADNGEEE